MKKIWLFLTILFSTQMYTQIPISLIIPANSNIGIILGDVVNVRQEPGVSNQVVDSLMENDRVDIINWTDKQETIGKFTDKWVKVKTKKGKVGYLFGAFLFELNKLFNRWRYSTNYAMFVEVSLTLKKDFTCTGSLLWGVQNPLNSKNFSNKFLLKGKEIIFDFNPHSYLDQQKFKNIKYVLYMYRYKGQNVLLDYKNRLDKEPVLGFYKIY